jgi:hypothetical protein
VLAEAKRRGAPRVELGTADGASFHERLGFTQIGVKYAHQCSEHRARALKPNSGA